MLSRLRDWFGTGGFNQQRRSKRLASGRRLCPVERLEDRMMLSGVDFPPEPYHLDDQSAEPMAPGTNDNPCGSCFVLIDRPDELLKRNSAATPTGADAGKLETYDYPGEYAQRFDGVGPLDDENASPYLRFKFETVFTTKIDWSGPGDEGPEESITFVYGKIVVPAETSAIAGTNGTDPLAAVDAFIWGADGTPRTEPGQRFDWLVHLDRQVVSPAESLEVSAAEDTGTKSSVTDGTSNTLMVGERPPSASLPTLPQYWVFGTEVPAANQGWGKWEVSFPQNIVDFIDEDSYATDGVAVDPTNPNAEITIVVYSGRSTDGQDLAIIIAAGPGAGPHAKLNDHLMNDVLSFEVRIFNSYPGFAGGVFVAAGDVNADGTPDIIVGAGAGAPGGHVKVFSGDTGVLMSSFLAYPAGFSGGVVVAGGDVNGDGRDDVVVALDAIFAAEASSPTGLFSAARR